MEEEKSAVQLNEMDVIVMLESLKYSIQRVSDVQGTPYAVRQENRQRLTDAQAKLRQMALTGLPIAVLLESIKYSIQRVSDAQGTPYTVRQENLQRLTAVQEKLRQMREEG